MEEFIMIALLFFLLNSFYKGFMEDYLEGVDVEVHQGLWEYENDLYERTY